MKAGCPSAAQRRFLSGPISGVVTGLLVLLILLVAESGKQAQS